MQKIGCLTPRKWRVWARDTKMIDFCLFFDAFSTGDVHRMSPNRYHIGQKLAQLVLDS